MTMTKEKDKLVNEDRKRLLEMLLAKNGKTLKELYHESKVDFVNDFLHLLSADELEKFAPLLVDGKVVA